MSASVDSLSTDGADVLVVSETVGVACVCVVSTSNLKKDELRVTTWSCLAAVTMTPFMLVTTYGCGSQLVSDFLDRSEKSRTRRDVDAHALVVLLSHALFDLLVVGASCRVHSAELSRTWLDSWKA